MLADKKKNHSFIVFYNKAITLTHLLSVVMLNMSTSVVHMCTLNLFFPLWKVATSSPFLLSSLFLPPCFTYIIYVTVWQNESKKHVNGKK